MSNATIIASLKLQLAAAKDCMEEHQERFCVARQEGDDRVMEDARFYAGIYGTRVDTLEEVLRMLGD